MNLNHERRAPVTANGNAADALLVRPNEQQVQLTNPAQGAQRISREWIQQWKYEGLRLRQREDLCRWEIGKWWVEGEDKGYGKRKAIAIAIGFEVQTRMDYGYVVRNVATSLRNEFLYEALSWSHFKEVVPQKPDKQKYWLDEAVRNEWNVRELRQKIDEAEMATLSEEEQRRHWFRWYLERVEDAARIPENLTIVDPGEDFEFQQYLEDDCSAAGLAKVDKAFDERVSFDRNWHALIRRVLAKKAREVKELEEAA
jgi:hypothetical protein